jgi:hypothetical protein
LAKNRDFTNYGVLSAIAWLRQLSWVVGQFDFPRG